jgi:hypothetical protein
LVRDGEILGLTEIDGKYLLRACIANFRTDQKDIEALPEIILRLGQELEKDL